MKTIPLTKGLVAIVDDGDYADLSAHRWFAQLTKGSTYAKRCIGDREYGNRKDIFMHREIMTPGDGLIVDHINGNGLDNRRSNLRLCTRQQNQMNLHLAPPASGFRGVYFHKRARKWAAQLRAYGKHYYLGLHETAEAAAVVHAEAAIRLQGEFAARGGQLEGSPELVANLSKAINAIMQQGTGA